LIFAPKPGSVGGHSGGLIGASTSGRASCIASAPMLSTLVVVSSLASIGGSFVSCCVVASASELDDASLDPFPHPAPSTASVITNGDRSARRILGVYRSAMRPSLRGAKILVVGGGVSGLSAAVLAAERGAEVVLLDESSASGGMLASLSFRGVDCDLGSHRLHRDALDDATVARLVAPIDLRARPRRGVLVLRDRHIPYPPTWLRLAIGLGAAGPSFAAGFLARGKRWERDRVDARDDVGFDRFVRARVGDAAFEGFYRPYVEKVWGLEASMISQTVAKARVSTTAPWRLVGASPARPNEFLYPRRGLSSLVVELSSRARALGVVARKGHFSGVSSDASERFDRVLFGGRLRDIAGGERLEHRGLYLLYMALPLDRLSPFETWYTPERRFWFGRVSEIQNYSSMLRRQGETIACVEIPEGRWGRDARFDRGDALEEVLAQLRAANILPRGVRPIEVAQRFLADVYPLYDRGWIDRWERAMSAVCARGDVLPFGRQGLFLHCNIDACIAMAADAVDHVASGDDARVWHGRTRARLGVRVRD
jgi:protoporphyrinogen oxidase